jgi:hypothetical protein
MILFELIQNINYLNMQPLARCIIVDSTRSGKRIPDSQSKTIPIWCCTVNNAIMKYRDSIILDSKSSEQTEINPKIEWDTELHSLPSLISKSEHDQMTSLIPQFAQNLLVSQNYYTLRKCKLFFFLFINVNHVI